jgi:hypothetical protein
VTRELRVGGRMEAKGLVERNVFFRVELPAKSWTNMAIS